MRSNSKRQASTPVSRQINERVTAPQTRRKAPGTHGDARSISSQNWTKDSWVGRPDAENYQDLPESPQDIDAPFASSHASNPVVTVAVKPEAESSVRGAKEGAQLLNFGNDYSDAFVHREILPQNWVQNTEDVFKGYPKLQRLHELKRVQFERYAAPAIGMNCSKSQMEGTLRNMVSQHMQFDVIMVNGCYDVFPYERLHRLPLDSLSARPSFLFLWVPSTKIGEGRTLMEHWGFRKGEDIVYIVNSLNSIHAPAANSWMSADPVFRPTTWHCLMGLKGTVRRSTNAELINCNVDTDVILETSQQRANVVPEDIYNVVENFTSMSRKIHIVPEDSAPSIPVRPRCGWIILSPDVFSMGSLDPSDFRDRRTIPVSREIDALRPQTPPSLR